MEFVPGRASGSRHYCVEEEDTDEPLNQRPSLFPFLPSLSPSPSSSSSVLWGSSAPQQAEPSDWWRHHTSGSGSSVQHESVEKEHMFDKVVTPSDVGKLNRLVIPKQHAERYFPLDASANEKGLLLTFEDRTGKHWRFRYSYWNSSQSYVITKGWSRFVKEKHLDAGDIVSFGRGLGESGRHRLFIDWKPSPDPRHHPPLPCHAYHHLHHGRHPSVMPFAYPVARWGGRLVVPPQAFAVSSFTAVSDHLGYGYSPYWYSAPVGNPSQVAVQLGASVGGGGREAVSRVLDSAPGVHSNGEARTVRLFGVNLGRSASDDDPSRDAATAHGHPPLQLRLGASDSAESLGKDRQPVLDSDM